MLTFQDPTKIPHKKGNVFTCAAGEHLGELVWCHWRPQAKILAILNPKM